VHTSTHDDDDGQGDEEYVRCDGMRCDAMRTAGTAAEWMMGHDDGLGDES